MNNIQEDNMVSAKITLKNLRVCICDQQVSLCMQQQHLKVVFTYCLRTKNNGKSIMNIMSACIRTGDTIEIQCDGPDEQAMLDAEIKLIENNFASDEK